MTFVFWNNWYKTRRMDLLKGFWISFFIVFQSSFMQHESFFFQPTSFKFLIICVQVNLWFVSSLSFVSVLHVPVAAKKNVLLKNSKVEQP
jgi:hypothetical protein